MAVTKKIELSSWEYKDDANDFSVEIETTYTGEISAEFITAFDKAVNEVRAELKRVKK